MQPGKQAIDGLWHCLCPSFAVPPLIKSLPFQPYTRRIPRLWLEALQRPAHRSYIGRNFSRSALEDPSQGAPARRVSNISSIHIRSSTSGATQWNGRPIHELTDRDAHEALRKASTSGNYEMVHALLDLLLRERQEAPSSPSYLALILANTSPLYGSLTEVSKLLHEMEELGIVLDSAMYHAVLKVHSQLAALIETLR